MSETRLPTGPTPPPVALPHFPDRLHAVLWRNWTLVPAQRIADTVGAPLSDLRKLANEMGLGNPPEISADQIRRTALTVIRRNWHLLPYTQILTLLQWTEEKLAFTLQEDDFLYIKLGSLKPDCPPVRWDPKTHDSRVARAARKTWRRRLAQYLGRTLPSPRQPLFGFLDELAAPAPPTPRREHGALSPRFCYPYFALYGDPLLDEGTDLLPDGYLARMADSGVDGIWIQGVLSLLAPFPWEPARSRGWRDRRRNLRRIAQAAKERGVGVWIYLNEPRMLPTSFFDKHPELKGVGFGDNTCLCVSAPDVRAWLVESVESLCRDVPELAGIFTISASENPTNCFSHGRGKECPRCGPRGAAKVIADTNAAMAEGVARSASATKFVAWDWGWPDNEAEAIISGLPTNAAVMSVSEWSLPIRRGGVDSVIGEYSLSAVGPGPRATRHWDWARRRGLSTLAKTQLAVTWELGAVPYIPAVDNAARHAANLRSAQIDGLMLGWTMGGWPSPNLEVVGAIASQPGTPDPEQAQLRVAQRRFGKRAAPGVVAAWKAMSQAFAEFPYHITVVYNAPMLLGPSALLWESPTGYRATMAGYPYDDLDGWRAQFPPEVFASQFEKVARGFAAGADTVRALSRKASGKERIELTREAGVAEACSLHFGSAARQARFVLARRALSGTGATTSAAVETLDRLLAEEIAAAKRLLELQSDDPRIGFEASNQYYYVAADLAEKIVNCADLRERWIPSLRQR